MLLVAQDYSSSPLPNPAPSSSFCHVATCWILCLCVFVLSLVVCPLAVLIPCSGCYRRSRLIHCVSSASHLHRFSEPQTKQSNRLVLDSPLGPSSFLCFQDAPNYQWIFFFWESDFLQVLAKLGPNLVIRRLYDERSAILLQVGPG